MNEKIVNYTSKVFWKCNTCGFFDENFKFVYKCVEIPLSEINAKVKRISTQHCPKCSGTDINTNPNQNE